MRSDRRREQPQDVTGEAQAGSDYGANAGLGTWSQDRIRASVPRLNSPEFRLSRLLRSTGEFEQPILRIRAQLHGATATQPKPTTRDFPKIFDDSSRPGTTSSHYRLSANCQPTEPALAKGVLP
jgi:hypothetical protein